jgi:hypothetical protein
LYFLACPTYVCTHDGTNSHVTDARLERWVEIFGQVLNSGIVVLAVSVGLCVVQVEVLACSNNLFLFRMIQSALETRDQLLCVLLSMESVFTRRLLTTAPSRIEEGVDVG